ncbi:MAG TPA: Hpt domain-containing protein [Pirellulales bacterium]|nr:Hpt domain-containing protein [Pirellulales bacterium]
MTQTATADLFYSTLADDPIIGEIVVLYVAEMPDRVAALAARWDARDYQGLTTLAHQMKGAAGSHGFAQLTPYAARLEQLAGARAAEREIQPALDALLSACARVRCR